MARAAAQAISSCQAVARPDDGLTWQHRLRMGGGQACKEDQAGEQHGFAHGGSWGRRGEWLGWGGGGGRRRGAARCEIEWAQSYESVMRESFKRSGRHLLAGARAWQLPAATTSIAADR